MGVCTLLLSQVRRSRLYTFHCAGLLFTSSYIATLCVLWLSSGKLMLYHFNSSCQLSVIPTVVLSMAKIIVMKSVSVVRSLIKNPTCNIILALQIITMIVFLCHWLLKTRSRLQMWKILKLVPHNRCTFVSETPEPMNELSIYMTYTGNLGNNLFQYASALGIADLSNQPLMVETNEEFESTFVNVSVPMISQHQYLRSREASVLLCKEPPEYNLMHMPSLVPALSKWYFGPIRLTGFYQSYLYFDHIKDRIRSEFTFRSPIVSKADEIIARYRGVKTKIPTVIIGVHVRRGDMVDNTEFKKFGYLVANGDYLKRAMEYYLTKYPRHIVKFLVASNDLLWCKQNLDRPNVHFLEGNSRTVDLCVVSRCDGVIVTVGTFGWWSGYLSNGTVVYQKDFSKPGSVYGNLTTRPDHIFPPDWIAL